MLNRSILPVKPGGEPTSWITTNAQKEVVRCAKGRWLIALLLLIGTISVLGFWDTANWIFDLISHFRLQYSLVLAIFTVLFYRLGLSKWGWLAGVLALINVTPLALFGLTAVSPLPPPIAQPAYSVLMLNVGWWNDDYEAVKSLIETSDPDLILLQETSFTWVQALQPVLADYAYNNQAQGKMFAGTLLYSRLPISTIEPRYVEGIGRSYLLAEVAINGRLIQLVGVHTISPKTPQRWRLRNQHLAGIADFVATQTEPVLLLGDLNVTPWSSTFISFLEQTGLENGRSGFGIQPTWPAQLPLIRIPVDHALNSSEISIHNLEVGDAVGSDHLPLLISFSVNATPTDNVSKKETASR